MRKDEKFDPHQPIFGLWDSGSVVFIAKRTYETHYGPIELVAHCWVVDNDRLVRAANENHQKHSWNTVNGLESGGVM